MMYAIEKLVAYSDADDPHRARFEELEPLWIAAIDQRFQECRPRIKVLDQLAAKAGIDRIARLADVVPLLFAHTVYKSYPEAFIDQNRWDRMNLWLSTLSKRQVEGVDVSGVTDADAWIARLHEHGHFVFATSGTSGKNSFIDQSAADVAFANKVVVPRQLRGAARRPIFVLGPRHAPNRASATFLNLVAQCGREGAVHFLTEERLRISDLSQMARVRRRIGEGVATPSEIAGLEQATKSRQSGGQAMLSTIAEKIIAHRQEPILLIGLTPQLYSIVEAARAQGLTDGCFHPDTIVISGGGAKGINLPADHIEQIMRFLGIGLDSFTQGYGMQEATVGARMVERGRYEFPPWTVPLLLNDSGDALNETRTGQVTGRMALFDVAIEGRWAGIVSGDKVTIDYDDSPTGRSGPAVLKIDRYSDLEGGDDKLTCAGTIDSFVRGAIDG